MRRMSNREALMDWSGRSAAKVRFYRRSLRLLYAVGLVAVAGPSPGWTQVPGCATTLRPDPPRQVLLCADGLTLTAEPETQFRVLDSAADHRADRIEVGGHGLMIELTPATKRQQFQILTPHAVATVRGTTWAVDVTPSRTSIFVQSGVVAVSRVGGSERVAVRNGEGVDVEAGERDLTVRRWPPDRAARLLARFGR